jgi:hypothetical protein
LQRLSRRAFLARVAGLLGVGLIYPVIRVFFDRGEAESRSGSGTGSVEAGGAGSSLTYDFGTTADREGWDSRWLPLHYERRMDVRDGWARFELPAGLRSSAPAQPMPISLLDCDSREGAQELTFKVSNASLRPGLAFQGALPFEYSAVTVEGEQLMLSRYVRNGREILRQVPVSRLEADATYELKVDHSGGHVRAKLWRDSDEPASWQLDALLPSEREGWFGILLVHPRDRESATLSVQRYRIAVPGSFSDTKPAIPFVISGIPEKRADGSFHARVRAASSLPAEIQFEWSDDRRGPVTRKQEHRADSPPYTAATVLRSTRGRDLRWRARVSSLSSGAETVSDWHAVGPQPARAPLVLGAASCAQMWGKPSCVALTNAREAAPAPIRVLVYQGDIGYANNRYRSCYLAAQDFFADRFTRLLADPHFTALRRTTSASFTLDDHDYGPRNNASAGQVEKWAIDLWNQMHADTSNRGYFDFRFDDVHCLTLDNRRYSDPANPSPVANVSRLGAEQFAWMEAILSGSDAELFVIFSGGIFATRRHTIDCFLFGWKREYDRAMTLFHSVQLQGKRVVVISGDAHGLRIHHHPDPQGRPEAAGMSVVEFICAGLEARTWTPAVAGDPTLDPTRSVMRTSGLGLIAIDPPRARRRKLTLRAIAARPHSPGSPDLFRPLVLPFRPGT